MKDKTILIVDDEKDLVELVVYNLQRERFRALAAYDGDSAVRLALQHVPDLIVLDLMLPGKSGQEVTVALRSESTTRAIPIIMLTAKSDESDIVVGLTLGADDYVTKPFSMNVLLARIGALLRRSAQPDSAGDNLAVGELRIDRARHRVEVANRSLALTLTEFRMLEALASAKGRVLSRNQLMDHAMGDGTIVTDRTVDVHITSLRKKLAKHRDLIETVRGVGYRCATETRP